MAEITHLSPEESRVVFVLGRSPLYPHSVTLCGLVKDDNTRTYLGKKKVLDRASVWAEKRSRAQNVTGTCLVATRFFLADSVATLSNACRLNHGLTKALCCINT